MLNRNYALIVICCLVIGFISPVYASKLDKIKIYLFQGDYKSAIIEGEKLMAQGKHAAGEDELYYLLGICYLKDNNFLRAADIFEIILHEFKDSKFNDDAQVALGDVYFLKGEYEKAQGCYEESLKADAARLLRPQVYYRLSEVNFKMGNTEKAKLYLERLKSEFPLNSELKSGRELFNLPESDKGVLYSVQVGSFSNAANAQALAAKLKEASYDAFIEETALEDGKVFRVKVGKIANRSDAVILSEKLKEQGYPVRISP